MWTLIIGWALGAVILIIAHAYILRPISSYGYDVGHGGNDGLTVDMGFISGGCTIVTLVMDAVAGYLFGLTVFNAENLWFVGSGLVVGAILCILAYRSGHSDPRALFERGR